LTLIIQSTSNTAFVGRAKKMRPEPHFRDLPLGQRSRLRNSVPAGKSSRGHQKLLRRTLANVKPDFATVQQSFATDALAGPDRSATAATGAHQQDSSTNKNGSHLTKS
jgi:hypothetical protein